MSAIRSLILGMVMLAWIPGTLWAQLTPDMVAEIAKVRSDVASVPGLIRTQKLDEAQRILDESDEKVQGLINSLGPNQRNRALLALSKVIERQRTLLTKALQKSDPDAGKVSFVDEVAPIIQARCVGCHGDDNPRAGLSLTTFEGWRRGGKGGPLLVPGSSARSLLMARLTVPEDQGRMPRNGDPLSREELETIANWISQGAKFDGENESMPLADLIFESEKKRLNVQLPMATGKEKVSFKKDIAPWFVSLCSRCHNADRKSGGLSLETYYDMMKGGDSGEVILPGDRENSRLFRLVGGLELPRMPRGQARITRQNYEDLKQWFDEGNHFDGDDVRTPLRELAAANQPEPVNPVTGMSDAELTSFRQSRSEDQFKRALPNDPRTEMSSEHYLVLGNVSAERLQQVDEWAESALQTLHKTFDGEGQPWRGKLAIFVLKDRFSYSEFNQTIEGRRASDETQGYSKVTPGPEDAYVVLQDPVGDDAALQALLLEHLTTAYLQHNGGTFPAWVARGAGIVMALNEVPQREQAAEMLQTARDLVPLLNRPADVFDDASFSQAALGPVSYSMVKYLIDSGGAARFTQFVKLLQQGSSLADSFQRVYSNDEAAFAAGYLNSLKKR